MGAMDYTTGTVRDCCARVLAAATEPMTVAHIAELVSTTAYQGGRGLRQLEQQGAAVRERGSMSHNGRVPDLWRAAR